MIREDRVQFKLYAAQKQLDRLKEIHRNKKDISRDEDFVDVEITIDCFFAEIIGAIDSFLFQINKKLGLGLEPDNVYKRTIKERLNSLGRNQNLLEELDNASTEGNWYWQLNEYRNHSVHRSVIHRMRNYDPFDKEVTIHLLNNPCRMTFNPEDYMQKDVISYFDESLRNVQNLIDSIKMKEPILNN